MIPPCVVRVNGVDISCDVELGVSITHGRSGTSEQPDPATASLDIIAARRDTVDRLAINATLTVDALMPDGTAIRRFTGSITDVAVSWEDVDVANVQVAAASVVALLGRVFIGDTPWPQEIDGARAQRILSVVAPIPYETDFATGLDGWAGVGGTVVAWLPGAGPGGSKPAARATWTGTVPLPLQAMQYRVTGLLPGAPYQVTAVAHGGTGGIMLAQGGGGFGGKLQPTQGWSTITLTGTADTGGTMLVQFWPTNRNTTGVYGLVSRVTVTARHQIPVGMIDPGTVAVLARDVDRQPCLGLLQELAEDCGGLAWHTRDGAICYADAEHRRNTPISLTLDNTQILMAPQWMHSTEGVTNDITTSYGPTPEGGEQAAYRASDAASMAAYGRLAVHRSTQLADLDAATGRTEIALARGAWPVWNMPSVPVELAVPAIGEALTAAILSLDVHALITVTGLPSQGPASTATLWVEGWAEEISSIGATGSGSWQLTLAVSDYCRTSAFVRWDDVPETLTWDEADPALTWNDLYCLGPPGPGAGRWNDVAANTRWDTAGDTTWDNWGTEGLSLAPSRHLEGVR